MACPRLKQGCPFSMQLEPTRSKSLFLADPWVSDCFLKAHLREPHIQENRKFREEANACATRMCFRWRNCIGSPRRLDKRLVIVKIVCYYSLPLWGSSQLRVSYTVSLVIWHWLDPILHSYIVKHLRKKKRANNGDVNCYPQGDQTISWKESWLRFIYGF